jgi:hypothetical protein
MVKIKTLICGNLILQDTVTNQTSIINIIEVFKAEALPLFVQNLYFYMLLDNTNKDIEEYTLDITLKNNDLVLFKNSQKVLFPNQKGYNYVARAILNIQQIVISDQGNLTFTISCQEKDIASLSIPVVLINKPKIVETELEKGNHKLDKTTIKKVPIKPNKKKSPKQEAK